MESPIGRAERSKSRVYMWESHLLCTQHVRGQWHFSGTASSRGLWAAMCSFSAFHEVVTTERGVSHRRATAVHISHSLPHSLEIGGCLSMGWKQWAMELWALQGSGYQAPGYLHELQHLEMHGLRARGWM